MDAVGLEFLAPLFLKGNGDRVMPVRDAARVMTFSERHIYELIGTGHLEAIKSGSDYRVMKRSLLMHLWDGWNGRHHARPAQITTFLLVLLGHLPIAALKLIADTCLALIAKRQRAEDALGLAREPNKTSGANARRSQTPPLFPTD